MLTEEEVYIGTKRLLEKKGYKVLGGQPPRGVDHLPVIEIKSGVNNHKGSKGAYKPDLVAFKEKTFYIIECKPTFNKSDFEKLDDILKSEFRILFFYKELQQRGILKKINYTENFVKFEKNIKVAQAYSGEYFSADGVIHILIEDYLGKGRIINLEQMEGE